MIGDASLAPVLVVEDNPEVRQALVALLEDGGFPVAQAPDGVSALRLLRAGAVHPCLIVLDLVMPRMDGWDFLKERRRDDRIAAIPVVVVSADPLALQATHLGVTAVLLKPTAPERLLELVGHHCKRVAQQRVGDPPG